MPTVEKSARLFRAGTYPNKGKGGADFVVTPADLARIAAGTTTASIIHVHDESSDRLDYGTVDGKSLFVKGDELWGTLSLEESAAALLELNGLKTLSAGIPYDMSKLAHVGMTRRPHIKDAAYFTDANLDCAYFSLTDESEQINDALDLLATFAGKTISTASADKINAAHDALATLHPDCCPASKDSTAKMSDTSAGERKTPVSIWNALKEKLGMTDAEVEAAKKEIAPAPVDHTAKFADIAKNLRQSQAEAFAENLMYAGKITAEGDLPIKKVKDKIIARFCRAAEDDENMPCVVTFSEGGADKTGTRLDEFKAEMESRKSAVDLGELLPGNAALFALANRENNKETEAEAETRREATHQRLLQYTPLANRQ